MYRVPLKNYPNQQFQLNVPVNGENRNFLINLRYNEQAKYWLISIYDLVSREKIVSDIPVLYSTFKFADILKQYGYKNIGRCYIIKMKDSETSAPNDTELDIVYRMLWDDNDWGDIR